MQLSTIGTVNANNVHCEHPPNVIYFDVMTFAAGRSAGIIGSLRIILCQRNVNVSFTSMGRTEENIGKIEVDAAGCQTVVLSEYVIVCFSEYHYRNQYVFPHLAGSDYREPVILMLCCNWIVRLLKARLNGESCALGNSHQVLVELVERLEDIRALKPLKKKRTVGEPLQARQLVEYAFGQFKSINDAYIQKDGSSNGDDCDSEDSKISTNSGSRSDMVQIDSFPEDSLESECNQKDVSSQSDKDFWKNFCNTINQNIVKQIRLNQQVKKLETSMSVSHFKRTALMLVVS
ncbi:hypothetical protein Tco_1533005 [Tanacetum coccineum]